MGKILRLTAGILGAGLVLGAGSSTFVDGFMNVEGDGVEPRNSITSRVLGVETGAECWRNNGYDHCSDSGAGYNPWCCKDETSVVDQSGKHGQYLRPAETTTERVATSIGAGSELLAGLGLLVVSLCKSFRKYVEHS